MPRPRPPWLTLLLGILAAAALVGLGRVAGEQEAEPTQPLVVLGEERSEVLVGRHASSSRCCRRHRRRATVAHGFTELVPGCWQEGDRRTGRMLKRSGAWGGARSRVAVAMPKRTVMRRPD